MPAAAPETPPRLRVEGDTLHAEGAWTVATVAGLGPPERLLAGVGPGAVTLDLSAVGALDTAGAWLIDHLRRRLAGEGRGVSLAGVPDRYRTLIERVETLAADRPEPPPRENLLAETGQRVFDGIEELVCFLGFTGEALSRLGLQLLRPWRIRWPAVVADLDSAGVRALGIVGLLSFLMGVVIAYQGAVQLKAYGANLYVADLVGLSMVRELAPLLAAIIVAGRTGSAYTAQIGTMQVTEEVAALRTIGIAPLDVLVLPKLLSLTLALPLLSVFADLAGVFGGMLMARVELGLGFVPFLDRLGDAVSVRSFLLGLLKAPVFAVIIALIGCFQGFRVSGSAASVGHHTTLSVVQSIFLVIVADAQFSVLFSWLGI